MKVYCSTCGGGTNYAAVKPKFCASCGEAFSVLNKTPVKRVLKANPKNPIATIQEEVEEEEFEMPSMNQLEVDVSESRLFNIVPMDKLAGSNVEGNKEDYRREPDLSYSEQTLAADFMRDAGSSRKNDAQK
tara:strand:+ start:908 stop:1300 length:393 start_codon:yes stop_codon:yes gene_type:complete